MPRRFRLHSENNGVEYTELRQFDDNSGPSAASEPHTGAPSSTTGSRRLQWMAYVVVLCTVINASLLFLDYRKSSDPSGVVNVQSLPRPNPYPGLESVLLKSSSGTKPPPLTTWPEFLGAVNNNEPSRVYAEEPLRKSTSVGMVYPAEKRFRLGDDVHTIVQFRVRDFGMENCTISLGLSPPRRVDDQSESSGSHRQTRERDATDSIHTVVEIWHSHTTEPINAASLSWATRPKAEEHIIDGLSFSDRSAAPLESRSFHCPSRTLQTFRLSCRRGDCDVDFWQGKDLGSAHGVTMRQAYSL